VSKLGFVFSIFHVISLFAVGFYLNALNEKVRGVEFKNQQITDLLLKNQMLTQELIVAKSTVVEQKVAVVQALPMSDEYKIFLIKTVIVLCILSALGVFAVWGFSALKGYLASNWIVKGVFGINMFCSDMVYKFLGYGGGTYLHTDSLNNTFKVIISNEKLIEIYIRIPGSKAFEELTAFLSRHPDYIDTLKTVVDTTVILAEPDVQSAIDIISRLL
jgi:hypothetical protein